jgi:predicted DNA-binding mobile mystery protein A
MQNEFKELRIRQLERTLVPFQSAAPVPRPHKGWVRAIREALGLSSGDMAARMGTSRQLIIQQENAEAQDRITLKSLRALANALDCELVYALVPRRGNLSNLAASQARNRARNNVIGVEHSMALESQASGHVDEAIEAEARRLARMRSAR